MLLSPERKLEYMHVFYSANSCCIKLQGRPKFEDISRDLKHNG